jgi:poly-gamma-glutamate capsule biosynthesis protein CapA/YwtB (metallophosphatase superfamily)
MDEKPDPAEPKARRRSILASFLAATCLWTTTSQSRAADAPTTVSLIFVGDIMVAHDEETGRLIERGEDPFEPFAGLLKEADVAVGNLECVIAEKGEPVPKTFQFLADPRCIPVLKKHFTALTVANNHSGDFGKLALVEQCERLEKANLPYFGGGRNKSDAHKPWIVERHGIRIALLGYCEVLLPSFQAENDLPGVAWSEYDDDVLADIKAAREKYQADVVIPFLHWGWARKPANDRQKTFARRMIDAGADVIIGAHPHVTQGAAYYKGHLIVYSLGNFLFNGFHDDKTQTGWALRLTVNRKGMVGWDTIVARLDERGVPHPHLEVPSPSGRAGSSEIVQHGH